MGENLHRRIEKHLVVITAIALIITTLAFAGGNPALLRLYSLSSTANYDYCTETYVTSDTSFDLEITNKAKFGADNLHLVISLPGSLTLDGTEVWVTKPDSTVVKITSTNWQGPGTPDYSPNGYNFPKHDIFPAYYNITDLGAIGAESTLVVPIRIKTPPPATRVHFDALGLTDNQVVLKSPFSKDVEYISEFPLGVIVPTVLTAGGYLVIAARRRLRR